MRDDRAADLDLAQRCLEGDGAAIGELQSRATLVLRYSLGRVGASSAEAEELVTNLWTECVCGRDGHPARLSHYRGQCPLVGWLKVVVMNQLFDRKRREGRWQELTEDLIENRPIPLERTVEAPLLQLMRQTVTTALVQCPSEPLVMLQLIYLHGLTQRDLAKMWGWHESKISRVLGQACDEMAAWTLEKVREVDPSITLTWEDFIELCQCADFSVFV